MAAIQTIDYASILDESWTGGLLPAGACAADDFYLERDGVHFRSKKQDARLSQDMVRLSDRAFLFASEYALRDAQLHRQIVTQSDWVHVQFRLGGSGREHVSESVVIETPEKSCVVARYPKDAIVDRTSDSTDHWKVACLFISPKGLTELLDIAPSALPPSVTWLAAEGQFDLRASTVPLQAAMVMAVNDILTCPFRGGNRRAYMRAKSLELLSTVIHTLSGADLSERSEVKLSSSDKQKIALAKAIMTGDLESTLTLAELARKIGLNRTKLALGFKDIYGVSVQAFWRDVKLCKAREMLRDGEARVTEVALSLGYSELSSFTRAFTRKFGVLPRNCKRGDSV